MRLINRLAIVSILVHDQDEALRFYTEKLGFEKRADILYGPGMRWLTVAPRGQKGPEIALARPDARLYGEKRAREMMECIGQGTTWVFDTDDCCKAYHILRSRGVTFVSEPVVRVYGIEAIFKDQDGNLFSLLEPSSAVQAQLAGDEHPLRLLLVA